MNELQEKIYEVLMSHNHEIVMSGEWLANLAREIEEAVRQINQRTYCFACNDTGIIRCDSVAVNCPECNPANATK